MKQVNPRSRLHIFTTAEGVETCPFFEYGEAPCIILALTRMASSSRFAFGCIRSAFKAECSHRSCLRMAGNFLPCCCGLDAPAAPQHPRKHMMQPLRSAKQAIRIATIFSLVRRGSLREESIEDVRSLSRRRFARALKASLAPAKPHNRRNCRNMLVFEYGKRCASFEL